LESAEALETIPGRSFRADNRLDHSFSMRQSTSHPPLFHRSRQVRA
jgi:hypothetical protein